MSYGREIMEEQAPMYEAALDRAYAKIWTIRDGSTIKVKDMTTAHINNCLHMLGPPDNDDLIEIWITTFEEELKERSYK